MEAECICANAVEFDRYDEFDVFYFYNAFAERIWAVYYHPDYGALFDQAGFQLKHELRDKTRDTTASFYRYPAK